jgi:DNA-directed RNA polymerase subunit L
MININKINIQKIMEDTEIGNSRLEFNIKGSNINYIIINTIRRTILSYIPIYAFNEFKFEKNTSIFHNNYLKLRLSCLPVWGIENTIDEYNNQNDMNTKLIDEKQQNDLNYDENYIEVNNESLDSSTLKQLTMYVNYKNKTNEIISVTTNDAKFYYNQKLIPSPYKNNILLIKLQPKQEISFSAITTLGIEEDNAIYSPVCIVTYKQINDNEFNFILESRGQITEKRILIVSIINIQKKLKHFKKLINDTKLIKTNTKNEDEQLEGTIEIHNEDHTLGNLISRGLQQHKNILFAGYNLPHPLSKIIIFHYSIKSNANIIDILMDVSNYYIDFFENIKNEINKSI